MAFDSIRIAQAGNGWDTIATLVRTDGSAAHRLPPLLVDSRTSARVIADAVHLVAMLHGRHPGIIDQAAARCTHPAATDWMAEAATGFAIERGYLTYLVSAAGPIPSTPGQIETEATVASQRRALDTLAQSDRMGCAIGAAVALVLDWITIRVVLDTAAERVGRPVLADQLPEVRDMISMVAAIADAPAIERAMAFGAQQVLAQHRGLWDLIEARASARGDI